MCECVFFQLRGELSNLGVVVSTERLTTIILDALSVGKKSTTKVQAIRDPDLRLQEIMSMAKIIFLNHNERSSVPERGQESYRKGHSGRESRMRGKGRESAMTTVLTYHTCKNTGH